MSQCDAATVRSTRSGWRAPGHCTAGSACTPCASSRTRPSCSSSTRLHCTMHSIAPSCFLVYALPTRMYMLLIMLYQTQVSSSVTPPLTTPPVSTVAFRRTLTSPQTPAREYVCALTYISLYKPVCGRVHAVSLGFIYSRARCTARAKLLTQSQTRELYRRNGILHHRRKTYETMQEYKKLHVSISSTLYVRFHLVSRLCHRVLVVASELRAERKHYSKRHLRHVTSYVRHSLNLQLGRLVVIWLVDSLGK